MTLRIGCGWTISSLLLVSACSSETPSDGFDKAGEIRTIGPLAKAAQVKAITAPSQTVTTQMTLPSTLDKNGFLVAQTKVQIDSGVTLSGAAWSAGTFSMQPDAKAQAVTCTGNVVLTDRDTITTLTTGGTITQGNGNVIGSLTRTALTNVTTSSTVSIPTPSQAITLNSGQSKTLNPGSYTSLTASSGSTLTLLAGDYFFSSLTLESNAILKLSPTQGATRIYVVTSFVYRPTVASGADASRLFVEYLGTNPVVLETAFLGTMVAPRSFLSIGTANGQTHRGTFTAQSIEVQPNAKLEFVKFNPTGTISACAAGTWDPDGNPFTPCVTKTACAAGSYVVNEGSTTSDSTCAGCASGHFSTVSNAPACTAWTTCVAGTFVANTPSSTTDRICLACPAGQYSAGDNQSQCLAQGSCAAGTVQTAAATPTSPPLCSACEPGQYCAGGTNPQTLCAAGTWDNDSNPSTACITKTTCVAGSFVANEGTTTADRSCQLCGSEQFSAEENATNCTAWSTCAAGSFVSNTPSTTVDRACSACGENQFSTIANAPSCTPAAVCAAGNYVGSAATSTSDTVCTICADGTFSTTPNAAECATFSTCPAGTFVSTLPSSTNDRACTNCPTGQFSTGSNASSCTPAGTCPPGTVVIAPATSTSDVVCGSDPLKESLALLLHMSETSWTGSAGEAVDGSGLANHGTAIGSATTNSNGKFGRGGLFDGDGWVTVADAASLRATSALTMSAWIYPTNIGSGWGGIISKRNGYLEDEAYDMFLGPDGYIYVDIDFPNDRFTTNTVFQNNVWYHVAVVFDGTLPAEQRARVYVNGVLDVTAYETSTTIPPYAANLDVGMLRGGGSPFVGTIDEVAIWTRALSQTEIAGLASATSQL